MCVSMYVGSFESVPLVSHSPSRHDIRATCDHELRARLAVVVVGDKINEMRANWGFGETSIKCTF